MSLNNISIDKLKEAHASFETYLSFDNTHDDKRLIGVFEQNEDGTYSVHDLRMSDFSRIEQYKVIDINGNESEPQGIISIIIKGNSEFAPVPNSYYYFHWKFTDNNPDNLCEITFDETKPIEILTPKDIVTLLYEVQMHLGHGDAQMKDQTLDTLTKQLTASDDEIFIYELLQNANDYPHSKGEPVNVEIRLSDNYLVFRHTGAEFTPKNVAALCNANDKDKSDNPDAIGYKGIGFKTVFNFNDYVYLLTGGFSFCYDANIKKKKNRVPWKITPIWTEECDIKPEFANDFLKSKDNFRVQFALKPINHSKLREEENSFHKILEELFVDESKILFIPNLGTVKVFLDSNDNATYNCSRNSKNWHLSKVYENHVDPSVTEEINKELEEDEKNNISRIPVKYKNFTKTGVSFACKVEGRKLIPQDNAIMYCYLPAEDANWGFRFFMNSDMIPNGPRKDIEHGLKLNLYLAQNAGKMFCEWLKTLVESKDYDYETIFSLVPDFDQCLQLRPVNKEFVAKFKDGFESVLDKPLIPDADGIPRAIKEIIYDKTGITSAGIITDEQFYLFSDMAGYLPHPSLRKDEDFRKFITRYLNKYAKDNIFTSEDLKECCQDSKTMQDWLLVPTNNGAFLNFLLSFSNDVVKEFSKIAVFIDNNIQLRKASDIYYSGDNVKQALQYLKDFVDYIPHLSFDTIAYFKDHNSKQWSEVWPSLGFKQLNAGGFVGGILFSDENKAKTLQRLGNLDSSVRFFKYLSLNSKDRYENLKFSQLPFFNSDGIPVNGFGGRLVFYEEKNKSNKAILDEAWFNKDWAYFINDAYTEGDDNEDVWNFLLDNHLVKLFESKVLITEVLCNKSNHEFITTHTRDNILSSVSFVKYVYEHKHQILADSDFKLIPLSVSNLDGKSSFEICNDLCVYPEIKEQYKQYSWMKSTWIYLLDKSYAAIVEASDIEDLNSFLRDKFGVKMLNDKNFYYHVAKKHRMEISKNIAANKNQNIDYYNYLAKHLNTEYVNSENLASVFDMLPVIDFNGNFIDRQKSNSIIFQNNDQLKEIIDQTWFEKTNVTMISPDYSFSNAAVLFSKLGYTEYRDSEFGTFFSKYIYGSAILDTKDKISDFHHFICNKVSKLNAEQLNNLKVMPTCLYATDGIRIADKCSGFFLMTDIDIKSQIRSGMLPEINAIDSSLCDSNEMIGYWKQLDNITLTKTECCKWIKSRKQYFLDTILDTPEKNIVFWRWAKETFATLSASLSELSGLPVVSFSKRDSSGNELEAKARLWDDKLYMSNSYHKGIEAFANKYGEKVYVSSCYVADPANAEEVREWRNFFRSVGIKDDVKDVIRQIIEDDLSSIQDISILSVLTDQFSTELEEEWDTLKEKLKLVQVKLKNSDRFIPISIAVIPDAYDIGSEPMAFIQIPNEISHEYLNDGNVRTLLKNIAAVAKTEILHNREEWMRCKVNTYLSIQDSLDSTSGVPEVHVRFIESFADVYYRNSSDWKLSSEASKIKLYGKDGKLYSPSQLTLGHAYNPYCDFEGHGVSNKLYIHDIYSHSSNRKNLLNLFFEVFKIKMTFSKSDLDYLTHAAFCKYYWTEFLPGRTEPKEDLEKWIEEGALNGKCCIPNLKGEICAPESLYSSKLKDFVVKKISNWEGKIIAVGNKNDDLNSTITKLKPKDRLDFSDCLEFLLTSAPDDYYRSSILRWIAAVDITERERIFVNNYRNSKHALWLNGKKKPTHIKDLYALSSNNNKKVSSFRTDPNVLDIEKIKSFINTDDLSKALKILGMTEIDDKMLEPECTEDGPETATIIPDIKLRLLALIVSREGTQWYDLYYRVKQTLSICKFIKCSRISYRYGSLVADKEKFLCSGNIFYYVKNWQKRAFNELVAGLNEKLKLEYDIHDINDILDHDEYDDEELLSFFNEKCGDLYTDVRFIDELKAISPSIVNKIDTSHLHDYENETTKVENEEIPSVTGSEPEQKDNVYDPYQSNRSNQSSVSHKEDESHSTDSQDEEENNVNNTESDNSSSASDLDEDGSNKEQTRSGQTNKGSENTDNSGHETSTNTNRVSNSQNPANESSEEDEKNEVSWNERIEDKWKDASQREVKKPTGRSMGAGNYTDVTISSNNINNTPDNSSFIDDAPTEPEHQANHSTFKSNSKAKENILRKNTEARNAAQKTEDQMSNVESMEETRIYSYKWFKYLNELLLGDKAKFKGKTVTVFFKQIRVLAGNDIVRLELPLNEIPRWVEYADKVVITIFGDKTVNVEAEVAAYQENCVELKIDSFDENWIHGVNKIKFYAEASSNFFESLYLRFLQLGYEDDYDMNANLPTDIDFIYGPPGTGKTTRIAERIHDIIEKENGIDILVLTPTNKAADVVAERLIANKQCEPYLSRYGTTESPDIVESRYYKTRTEMDMYETTNNIVVTTAARYPYDCVMNEETPFCEWSWDYVIIDEASMMDILIITYILHQAKGAKFIVSGDPKQIEPIDENKIGLQNIYAMVGLNSFKDALNSYDRYPVEVLTTQHRSVPAIGNLVSKYTYDGLLKNDDTRDPQKPLEIDGMDIKNINIVGFKIEPLDMMYGISTNGQSTYHLYSAIFTYNMAGYIAKKITEKYPNSQYSIGIICPYRAEADAIKQMLDSKPLDTNVCRVSSGTVHKFQGDECDIMFVALTPPSMNRLSDETHINNQNIINVAMSRARDYIFFVMPYSRIENFVFQSKFSHIVPNEDRTVTHCSEIEELMFDNRNYIYENTNISCHLPVNVYYESDALYDVRMSDDALDIKIKE